MGERDCSGLRRAVDVAIDALARAPEITASMVAERPPRNAAAELERRFDPLARPLH
jgi:hypothetical protein